MRKLHSIYLFLHLWTLKNADFLNFIILNIHTFLFFLLYSSCDILFFTIFFQFVKITLFRF